MKSYFIVSFLLLTLSCNQQQNNEELIAKVENSFDIKINKNNVDSITEYKYSFSLNGDYFESFVMHCSTTQYESIFKTINPKYINTTDSITFSYTINQNRNVHSLMFYSTNNTIKYTAIFE